MKKNIILALILTASIFSVNAQEITNANGYHRSSLLIMPLVHTKDSFSTEILYAAEHMPFPDRYNNINGEGSVVIKADNYSNHKLIKDTTFYKNYLRVLNEEQLAKEIVKYWFSFDAEKGFSTSKIISEGMYDASALQKELSHNTLSGSINLADAGDELISKSFVLLNDMSYINHAERAQMVSDISESVSMMGKSANELGQELQNTKTGLAIFDLAASLVGAATSLVGLSAELVGDITKSTNELLDIKGFAVLEATYLFQIDWSEQVQNIFYSRYYTETGDKTKIDAFLADTETFKLKYVGAMPTTTNNATAFNAGSYSKLSQNDQILITCTRTMDDAINNLQSCFPEFRVYTPITGIKTDDKGKMVGIIAPIGTKEGVTTKKKYAIRQMVMTNGKTKYEDIVPSLKASDIWDNRFNIESEQTSTTEGTLYKTKNSKIFKGMLLIEK